MTTQKNVIRLAVSLILVIVALRVSAATEVVYVCDTHDSITVLQYSPSQCDWMVPSGHPAFLIASKDGRQSVFDMRSRKFLTESVFLSLRFHHQSLDANGRPCYYFAAKREGKRGGVKVYYSGDTLCACWSDEL